MRDWFQTRGRNKFLRNEKGVILPIALIFLVILSIMGIAAIMTSTSTSVMFGGLRRSDDALYNAEAGVEMARRLIAQSNPNFDQVYMDDGVLPGLEGTFTYGNGSYTVKILNNEDDPGYNTDPALNVEKDGRYVIQAIGRVGDATKTLEVVVESFSRFFWFTEYEIAPGMREETDWTKKYVFFRDGDILDGPAHTNHEFHIAYGTTSWPEFRASASANAQPFYLTGTPSSTMLANIFQGPTNWARLVNLPVGPDKEFGTPDDLDEVLQGATTKGKVIDTQESGQKCDYRIFFTGESGKTARVFRMEYTPTQHDPDGVPGSGDEYTTEAETAHEITGSPFSVSASFNGVFYFYGGGNILVGGHINDDGTLDPSAAAVSNNWVNGRWTVCSGLKADVDPARLVPTAGEIRIQGDIKYIGTYGGDYGDIFPIVTTDGVERVVADGLLGLVSQSSIMLDYTAAIKANGVTIHASLMATAKDQFGGFCVDTGYTNDTPNAVRGDKNLNAMGGFIQYYRGVIAKFEQTGGIRTGFQKNYKYDTRLYYMMPPSFPVAVNLKNRSWKE